MRDLSADWQAELAKDTPSLATLWKLTRQDATIQGFTDYQRDLSYHSVVYSASSGRGVSALDNSARLNVDHADIAGWLEDSSIEEADILAGIYDHATIELLLASPDNAALDPILLSRGFLGEVTLHDGNYVVELRGLAQHLQHTIGELYSPSCRAVFGSSACGVDRSALEVSTSVTDVSSRLQFTASALTQDAGYFDLGLVTVTSGANAGQEMEVKFFSSGGIVNLMLPLPYELDIGDNIAITPGCDKRFSTCKVRYANAINFRGEPFVPGNDKLLETAATRSTT